MKSIVCLNCGHSENVDEIVAVKSNTGYIFEAHYRYDCPKCFAVHDIHMYPNKEKKK